MADFPTTGRLHKPVIASYGPEAIGLQMRMAGNAGNAAAAWPSANLAIFVPFVVSSSFLARKVWWVNGAPAGNVDVGVYSDGGALLASSGSTAASGSTVIQSVTLASPLWLGADRYYLAMACSSGAATFRRVNTSAVALQVCGVAQQASAFALPAAFTLASVANAYLPMFGLTRQAVI